MGTRSFLILTQDFQAHPVNPGFGLLKALAPFSKGKGSQQERQKHNDNYFCHAKGDAQRRLLFPLSRKTSRERNFVQAPAIPYPNKTKTYARGISRFILRHSFCLNEEPQPLIPL